MTSQLDRIEIMLMELGPKIEALTVEKNDVQCMHTVEVATWDAGMPHRERRRCSRVAYGTPPYCWQHKPSERI